MYHSPCESFIWSDITIKGKVIRSATRCEKGTWYFWAASLLGWVVQKALENDILLYIKCSILQALLARSCCFSSTTVLGKRLDFLLHRNSTPARISPCTLRRGCAMKGSDCIRYSRPGWTKYHIGHKARSDVKNGFFVTFQTKNHLKTCHPGLVGGRKYLPWN